MKVAIIHHWWLTNRGAESVVKAMIELYPHADLFVHVCDEKLVRETLGPVFTGTINTTFISKLPGSKKHYQKYLPLMPMALESLDLTSYDVVIGVESGPTKGVITHPDAVHICYCNSPMRYIWDMYYLYLQRASWLTRLIFPLFAHKLRIWDYASAARVDYFISNSSFIASRVRKYYRRESEVIFPPVNVGEFDHRRPRENFYLCLGQLVSYKRADLAVEVFNKLKLPLIIIGEGEIYEELKDKALPNVTLLGRQPFSVVKDHLERCKALVFPGLEDFGIVPVEAMASGAPVIAYGKGGALDTVTHGISGILFKEQTTEDLEAAVVALENKAYTFDVETLREQAMKFDKSVFTTRFSQFVQNTVKKLT